MSLISEVVGWSSRAIQLVTSYLTSPYVAGVRIEPVKYSEKMTSLVNEQVIVGGASTTSVTSAVGGSEYSKRYITDNVAPKPKRWSIEGYIAPTIFEVSAMSPVLQPSIMYQMEVLRAAARSRTGTTFIPLNRSELNNIISGALQVAIADLEFAPDPLVQNRMPVRMTLAEIPVLTASIMGADAIPQGITSAMSAEVDIGVGSVIAGAFSIPL